MTSLKHFLRKRLMLGSQYPSVEEEADRYIRELELHMMKAKPQSAASLGYASALYTGWDCARFEMLKFLKGQETVK